MTKKEIVKSISEEEGLTQLQIKKIVQRTFDAIIQTLLEEGKVELRNFGVFQIKSRAARKARNPRTGNQVEVPEKFVVTFKPGKDMEQRVRDLSDTPAGQLLMAKLSKKINGSADETDDDFEEESPSDKLANQNGDGIPSAPADAKESYNG